MRAIGYIQNVSDAKFLDNQMLQVACKRCVEVVGEAAGSVSESFRELHPTLL
jgi:uncharacterized protein with HEPN domain